MVNTNLHIYPSNIKHETRMLKETKSLADFGLFDRIFLVGIWEKDLKEHESLDNIREIWRVPLKTKFLPKNRFWKLFKYTEWMLRIFIRFKKERISFVNCHSLTVLPLGVLFKIFTKSKVIYDTHELETETCGMSGIRKKLSKVLEKSLIRHVDSTLVVSDSIATWYKNKYNLRNVHVIRNVPYKPKREVKESNILKEKFNIRDDEVLFIYQGMLGKGRGIEIMLNVFSKVDKKKHIVFMGYGLLEDLVKKYQSKFSNIHFCPAVKPEEVLRYTRSADVGIHIPEKICLSYFYSLPNKFFEYIFAGLPVIVSDFPDMGEIIDEYRCGWKIPVNEKSILDLIESISKEEIKGKRRNVLRCRDNFSWEREEEKLIRIYHDLSGRR